MIFLVFITVPKKIFTFCVCGSVYICLIVTMDGDRIGYFKSEWIDKINGGVKEQPIINIRLLNKHTHLI